MRLANFLRGTALILGAVLVGAAALALFSQNGRGADPAEFFSDPDQVAVAAAMTEGDTQRISELVQAGANLGALGRDGMTLLQWEMLRNGMTGFRELLHLGADPNQIGHNGETPLHTAARFGSTSYIERLLDNGGSPNAPDSIGRSPIFSALRTERQDNIDLLLERDANLDHADRNGMTPLMLAAAVNDYHNVRLFLEHGADPLKRDRLGDDFQDMLFKGQDRALLHGQANRELDAIIVFLAKHDIAVNPAATR